MIRFKSIFWKNLLSTGNVGIQLDLDKKRTTLLFGPSGSGKSTLLDALTFCLFNKPFRNINKNKLVNAINEHDCLVEVCFETNGHAYKIRRGIKPAIFEIYQNDILLNQEANSRDYQTILENQILKLSYKTFLQVVMLGAANFTPFMQLKPADRREIIEDLLDIQIFSVMTKLLKEKTASLKTSISDINVEVSQFQQNINLTEAHLKETQNAQKTQIEGIEKAITQEQDALKKVCDQVSVLRANLITGLDVQLKKNQAQLDKAFQLKISVENKIASAVKHIQFYDTNETCPTCKQLLDHHVKCQEVTEHAKTLEELERVMIEVREHVDIINKDKQSILEQMQDQDQIRRDINELELTKIFHEKNIQKYQQDITKVQSNDGHISNLKEDLAMWRDMLLDRETRKEKLLSEQSVLEYGQLILKDTGVKSKIIQEYIPFINKYVNIFLSAMSFYVTFKLDENFEEQIRYRGRDFFSYENFSEGERQRLDLALLFTWRCIAKAKNSVNTNLLIMDEVFDSYLDTAATENVLSIFKEDIFDETNIIVISHKESIVDKFDGIVKYHIEKGFSKVDS